MAEVLFRAKLVRKESTTPWGFRLQGGVEFDKPLTLLKVVQDSIAAKSGLHAGDIVVKLAGEAAEGMTHKNAQDAIRNAGNALEIIVERAEEEITLSPPNSPPSAPSPAVAKAKTTATPPANKKNEKKPSELKPAIKKDIGKKSPVNSPAAQKKNVKFADNVKKEDAKPKEVSRSPKHGRKQNDVQKKSDSKSPVVETVVDGAEAKSKSSHNQDANIPANSDQTQPAVESSKTPVPKTPAPDKNTPVGTNAHNLVPNSAANQKPSEGDVKKIDLADVKPDEKQSSEKDTKKPVENSLSHLHKPPPLPLPEGELETVLKPTKTKSNSSEAVSNGHIPQGGQLPKENSVAKKDEVPKNKTGVKVTNEVPNVPESNFVVVPGEKSEPVISERVAEKSPSNDKDFSQTAPWRVSQRKRESSLEQPSPPIPDADPIHPWRKSKQDQGGGARPKDIPTGDTAPALSSSTPGGETVSGDSDKQGNSGPDIQPSLILVGKRIESPTASGEFTFTQVPSEPYASQTPLPPPPEYGSLPRHNVQTSPPGQTSAQIIEEIISLKPSPEYLSDISEQVNVADPELLDIPMPTVKEMVADLHRRLEDIAIQHPKIAQLITPQELGLNFQRKLIERQAASGEKEIIIDCPPNYSSTLSVDDPRKKRTFLSPSFGSSNYDVTTSPDMQRRRYSLPGTYLSAQTPHRRVHFAEPVESSVVEIEPRHRKERRREIPPPVYSSASTLAEKLDRIERENAMASHAMNVSRSSREAERTKLSVPRATQPSTSPPRTEQILFSSTRPRMEGVTFKPLPHGGQGFSFSIGGDGPSQIRLSFTHDKNTPVIQATHRGGSAGGAAGGVQKPGFSYSISTGDPKSRTYSYSPTMQDQGPRVRIQDERSRLSPSFQSARDSPSRSPRTGSPRLDPYYQYRGSPTVPQQQPSYSNTLQIDTRSREQHSPQPRTPSPVAAYGYAPSQQMHSMPPTDSPQRQRAFTPRNITSPVGITATPPKETPTVKVSKFYTDSPARASPQRVPPAPPPGPPPIISPLASPVPRQQPGGPARGPGAPQGMPPIPGLFALFDKNFADKFVQWQAESQDRMQQSETLKLVQEMDEEKKYWDDMY